MCFCCGRDLEPAGRSAATSIITLSLPFVTLHQAITSIPMATLQAGFGNPWLKNNPVTIGWINFLVWNFLIWSATWGHEQREGRAWKGSCSRLCWQGALKFLTMRCCIRSFVHKAEVADHSVSSDPFNILCLPWEQTQWYPRRSHRRTELASSG